MFLRLKTYLLEKKSNYNPNPNPNPTLTMGCSPSAPKHESIETTFPDQKSKPDSARGTQQPAASPVSTSKIKIAETKIHSSSSTQAPTVSPHSPFPHGLSLDMSHTAATSSAVGNNSTPNTPNSTKKLTLLQVRSLSSGLSVQTGNYESSSDMFNLPCTPALDVVVPDDFRKKYKMLSIMTEKSMNYFAFHASTFHDEDEEVTTKGTEEEEEEEEAVNANAAAVIVYKGIDRQKKYVIVERTKMVVDVLRKSTIQIEYFNRIDLLRRINHVCIPSILDVFDSPHDYTIVRQYGVGKSLAELMGARGAITNKDSVKAVILALIDTLKHLHKQNIAHRNVTAENLIVSRFNHFSKMKELRLIGLGRMTYITPLASSATSAPAHTPPTTPVSHKKDADGKPITVTAVPEQYLDVFSAPELAQSNHTLAVDLYSLGVVIYSLIKGAVPTDKATIDVGALPCSAKLKHLIKALLYTDPAARYSLRKVEKFFVKSFLVEEVRLPLDSTGEIKRSESNSTASDSRSSCDDEDDDDEDDDDDQKSQRSQGSNCSSIVSSLTIPSTEGVQEQNSQDREQRALERMKQQEQSQKMLLEDDGTP